MFEVESSFYSENKPTFLQHYHGKFLLIYGTSLLGVFPDMWTAFNQLTELGKFYNGSPILIHQCLINEPCIGMPGGLTWLDDKGNYVEPDPKDIEAYMAGARSKYPADAFPNKF